MKETLEKAILNLQKGDTNSLSIIYDLTSKGVFTFVLPIVKNYSTAEDIMQQTYIKVFENVRSYREGTNARNWILTIAKNLAINEFNKNKKIIDADFDENIYQDDSPCILNESLDTPLIKLANQILDHQEFQIVIMHTVGEYKHREIADILNIPLGTVTWKYTNAIEKIRKEYLKREENEKQRLN